MGSQYAATQVSAITEKVVRRNSLDPTNILFWDLVKMNLSGMDDYDPNLPRVSKWNSTTNRIVSDIITYYDDTRVTAPTR